MALLLQTTATNHKKKILHPSTLTCQTQKYFHRRESQPQKSNEQDTVYVPLPWTRCLKQTDYSKSFKLRLGKAIWRSWIMLGYSFGFGRRARRITKQCYASKWKSHVLIESTKPQHLSDSCLHCIFEQGVKMLSINAFNECL